MTMLLFTWTLFILITFSGFCYTFGGKTMTDRSTGAQVTPAGLLAQETTNALRASKPSISQEMVDNFILETWTQTAGEKTTIVRAMLRNGFELVEASSCVSPENYDEKLGREICMKKIKDRVWHLLGFLLQTAVNGVK